MTIWILWVIVTIVPGQTAQIRIEEFATRDLCTKAAVEVWAPIVKKQFPTDRALAITCVQEDAEKVMI